MKKNLRNSLKNWVKRIKWIEYELIELEDKLHTYESNMFYYRSPTFEPRISSNSFYQSNLDFWIDKITSIEKRIDKYRQELKTYDLFILSMDELTFRIFKLYFIDNWKTKDIIFLRFCSQSKFYYNIDKILKMYNIIITR